MVTQSSRMIVAAFCVLLVAGCDQREAELATPNAPPAEQPAAVELSREELDARRIADLVVINSALQSYHRQHGRYPVSPGHGFTGVIQRGENWIPELVPTFIAALPRDPALSTDASRQYWYSSDGADFKLIVHGVSSQCGPEIERESVRIDPVRTRGDRCWAYGFWTEGSRGL
jgi:hypothetical protein